MVLQEGRPLPHNQWQLEVENWFKATLAAAQGWTVELATGPSDPRIMEWLQAPVNPDEGLQCKNQVRTSCPRSCVLCRTCVPDFAQQKILTTAYVNFNTFGLSLTLALGALIILFSWLLEPIIAFFQRRRQLDTYARLEWATNETLQLQRLAHEELGLGTWHGTAEAVPYTDGGQKLAVLDVADPEHPRLKAPPVPFDEELVVRDEEGRKESDQDGMADSVRLSGKIPGVVTEVRAREDVEI